MVKYDSGNFYLIEEALEIIRGLEANLRLNELDLSRLAWWTEQRKGHVRKLIVILAKILQYLPDDPRNYRLIREIKGLRKFLLATKRMCRHASLQGWVKRFPAVAREADVKIEQIISHLDKWEIITKEKIDVIKNGNEHLKELEMHPEHPGKFYILVKELDFHRIVQRMHPFNPMQATIQAKRKTADIIKYDPRSPITGARVHRYGDSSTYPSSGIIITHGHHRLFELCRRYLRGEISGDTLVEVKVDPRAYKRVKGLKHP
ncbi:hypothetical protein KY361_06830 [Candidatus Woesearchaeota archaeon]|nr:hypothetical protein [Candidatus Woesearchaeota archaeon]